MFEKIKNERWLSAAALWTAVGAWTVVGVNGWMNATSGILMVLTVTLTVALQVFGVRALKNAAQIGGARAVGLVLLGLGCLGWSGYSGHQGMMGAEAQRWAPWEAKEAADAAVAMIDAEIAAVPALNAFNEHGQRIGPITLGVLAGERDKVIAGLHARRAEAAKTAATHAGVVKPATRASEALLWALSVLIEAMEALGFLCLTAPRRAVVAGVALDPALSPSELARRLVANRKDRQPQAA